MLCLGLGGTFFAGLEDGFGNPPVELLAQHQMLELQRRDRDFDDGGPCVRAGYLPPRRITLEDMLIARQHHRFQTLV